MAAEEFHHQNSYLHVRNLVIGVPIELAKGFQSCDLACMLASVVDMLAQNVPAASNTVCLILAPCRFMREGNPCYTCTRVVSHS